MTTKADFTDEEWARLERAPFVAGMAISLADPGGPIEAVKETAATLRVVLHEAQSGSHGELVSAIAKDASEAAKHRHSPLSGFRPHSTDEIVAELRDVNRMVSEKASPEDAAAFREWLLAAAREAANAAKEGGFLGFHAERVSEGEQRMLDRLAETLATQA